MASTTPSGQLLVFDPRDPTIDSVKTYKVRKTHKKSRAGCVECKTRRVKCDESRPACGQCTRRSLKCSYLVRSIKNDSDHADQLKTSEMVLPQVEQRITLFDQHSTQQHHQDNFLSMCPTLWPGKASPQILADDPSAFTSQYDLPILHHLSEGAIGPSLFAENTPNFHIDVLSIARCNAHVMHALLAASALHIRFTQHPKLISTTSIQPAPSSLLACLTTSRSSDPFASIEAGHHLSAARLFRHALETLSDLANDEHTNIDALLTTCMLLNMLSFAGLPESSPPTSRWPFIPANPFAPPSARPLNWLRVQLGFGPLLMNLTLRMRENSEWLAFFATLGHEVLYDDRPGTVDIPPRFCAFFDISHASTVDTHPHLRLVRRLLTISRIYDATERAGGGGDRHDAQSLRYFQFVQGVDESWVARLEARDVKCLVVYGWFMAILCKVRHWWARVRAVRECGAVVAWLDAWCRGGVVVAVSGDDSGGVGGGSSGNSTGKGWPEGLDKASERERREVRQWLPFMARAVGYRLKCFHEEPEAEEAAAAELERDVAGSTFGTGIGIGIGIGISKWVVEVDDDDEHPE